MVEGTEHLRPMAGAYFKTMILLLRNLMPRYVVRCPCSIVRLQFVGLFMELSMDDDTFDREMSSRLESTCRRDETSLLRTPLVKDLASIMKLIINQCKPSSKIMVELKLMIVSEVEVDLRASFGAAAYSV